MGEEHYSKIRVLCTNSGSGVERKERLILKPFQKVFPLPFISGGLAQWARASRRLSGRPPV